QHQAVGSGRVAEDPDRSRARISPVRPHHHLRVRDGHDPELRDLCRRHDLGRDPGGAVRDAHTDHHRRTVVGDRYRRHGSSGALQRAGNVGPRGRGGGRRGYAPARQNRHHHARQPPSHRVQAVARRQRADAAQLASLADETQEGRSVVVLAKEKYGLRGRDLAELRANFIPFTAQSRMSGVEVSGSWVRKGAVDAILNYLNAPTAAVTPTGAVRSLQPVISADAVREVQAIADAIAKSGGTPLAVAKDGRLLGVVHLKDIVKGGIRERFAELRRMGIRTIMITGDNPMTAAAIAAEAGVDDFLAQATPEDKL